MLRITWRESGKVRERGEEKGKRGEREKEREPEKDRGYVCDMKERGNGEREGWRVDE